MNKDRVTVSGNTLRLLFKAIRNFLKSHVGGRAWLLLTCLFALMLCINGMNVANSYVGRWFMSAIESRDSAGFTRFAWLYLAVFAGSTMVGVLFRFTEERLGLLWRDYLTRRITTAYVEHRLYRLFAGEGSLSNPDQRMTEDVRQLTTTTLSFVLIVAPMFMAGKVEFGVIGQSAMAFATLLGAFSLVITQFQAISSYASVITRLEEFVGAAEKSYTDNPPA